MDSDPVSEPTPIQVLVVDDHAVVRRGVVAYLEALEDVAVAGEAGTGKEALDRLADSEILRALRELPEEFRTAVYLADIEGYPYREIAEIMGTPIGTVMSRLHRGRGKLRQRLASYAPKPKPTPRGGLALT